MNDNVKKYLKKVKMFYHKMKFFMTINWVKTFYFNFKKFPFHVAIKTPVVFYGQVSFQSIKGQVVINGPIERGMIGFGQQFEINQKRKKVAEIFIEGKLIFNGPMHMGKDVFLYIAENATCEFGYMSCLGSEVRLICMHSIKLGEWTGIGYQSQVIDTNSHPMINTKTKERYPMTSPIVLGAYNAVSNRVSFMPGTKTSDFCVIASNSLCNKDYTPFGEHTLIGGIPAKLIKENYSRDWEYERELLLKYKMIWHKFKI
jgi:acetyltransferase-like isoleucine patch superfamily enzyme